MGTLTENQNRAGAHVLEEQSAQFSRERVTIAAGADLKAGTVVAKVTASGKYVQLAPAAADGSQTAAGVLFSDANAASADVDGTISDINTLCRADLLIWPEGITGPQQTTALANLRSAGIKVR